MARINWQLAGEAWECPSHIIAGWDGESFCDTEVLGEWNEETNTFGAGGVERNTLETFLDDLKLEMSERNWVPFTTQPQPTDPPRQCVLSNGLGNCPASVVGFFTGEGDRIELWQPAANSNAGDLQDDNLALLQTSGGRVLIAGCACGHPFMCCNLFEFGNSDGSTDAENFDTASGELFVKSLCSIADKYVYEQEH
jgi:hypothetical protein